MDKKISFLSASISRSSGGLFEIERRVAQSLNEIEGNSVNVLGLEDKFSREDRNAWYPLQPQLFKVKGPRSFGFAPNIFSTLKSIDPDILHINAIWMYPSFISNQWRLTQDKPVVITINGMLDSWAVKNSRWKKKLVLHLFEHQNLRKAACIIVNTHNELKSVRDFGLKNPVAVIPNGVDLPEIETSPNKLIKAKRNLLFLGRIHSKKGIFNLVEAWKKVESNTNLTWKLDIVGWGKKDDVSRLEKNIKGCSSISFHGPQFGKDKETYLLNSDAFILPSFSEGLPMAILEAWSYCLPVIITSACNFDIGFSSGAAMKTDSTEEEIEKSILKINSISGEELFAMGMRGRELVSKRYTWKKVVHQIDSVYNWILNQEAHPDFVFEWDSNTYSRTAAPISYQENAHP